MADQVVRVGRGDSRAEQMGRKIGAKLVWQEGTPSRRPFRMHAADRASGAGDGHRLLEKGAKQLMAGMARAQSESPMAHGVDGLLDVIPVINEELEVIEIYLGRALDELLGASN